jgi:hypothetical protein
MGVIKNLLLRVGVDASQMRQALMGASKNLSNFKRQTDKSMSGISNSLGKLGNKSFQVKMEKSIKSFGGMTRSLGVMGGGMEQAALGALALGARLGPVGIGIGVLTGAAIAGTAAIAGMSQNAVKFEADMTRLNMTLGQGTRKYMEFAKAQGLSRSSAAQLGSTYGMILSSFIKDNDQLSSMTQQIVQTTRVVAAGAGKSLDETLERMRSGLLGNTEAIEDLGIFVNVAMLESTEAFKKFANGKSWDQIDFRLQQQIRLQAILEQAQKQYGNTIQNTVMAKQSALIEQWKDIKLNLSQAFLPIWDSVLPALSKLAGAVASVTETIARFIYRLKGWDYDAANNGTDKQKEKVSDLGDSYQKAGEQAKKSIAAFDEINQIDTGSGAGGSGGSGSSGGGAGGSGSTSGSSSNSNTPLLPKLDDNETGGFFGAVEKVKSRVSELETKLGGLRLAFTLLTNPISLVGVAMYALQDVWKSVLNDMQEKLNAYRPYLEFGLLLLLNPIGAVVRAISSLKIDWSGALNDMQEKLNAYRPYLEFGLLLLVNPIGAIVKALSSLKIDWQGAFDSMQKTLNAYRPYLEFGLLLLINPIGAISKALGSLKIDWHGALDFMQSKLDAYRPYIEHGIQLLGSPLSGLVGQIQSVVSAWNEMVSALSQPLPAPQMPSPQPAPQTSESYNPVTDFPKPSPLTEPPSGLGAAAAGLLIGGGIFGTIGKSVGGVLGKIIPAFATGGIVTSPTIAQIGEAGSEMVVPLENTPFVDKLASALGTAVMTAMQMNNNSSGGGANIVIDGVTLARAIQPYTSNESTRIGNSMIVTR